MYSRYRLPDHSALTGKAFHSKKQDRDPRYSEDEGTAWPDKRVYIHYQARCILAVTEESLMANHEDKASRPTKVFRHLPYPILPENLRRPAPRGIKGPP